MRPDALRTARQAMGLTQQRAAARLGVSQAYLALMEGARRPVTARVASKMVRVYRLGPTCLPLETGTLERWDSNSLAKALASLGYAGFHHLGRGRKTNPAVILLAAIAARDLEVRVIEALPWLVFRNSDLDWAWLIREAKQRDLQNRLGFLVTLGRRVAERRDDDGVQSALRAVEEVLERARLAAEDTLCQESLSRAEREWLRKGRPPEARQWNLLTDLRAEDLRHAA